MPRCPNCFRETMRTKDWACYLCGYPLVSPNYKPIDKTYSQIRAERLHEKKPVYEWEQSEEIPEEKSMADEMQDVPLVDTMFLNEKVNTAESKLCAPANVEGLSEEAMLVEPIIEERGPREEPVKYHAEEESPEKIVELESLKEEVDEAFVKPESIEYKAEITGAADEKEEEPSLSAEDTIAEAIDVPYAEEEEITTPIEPEPAPPDLILSVDELLSEYAEDYTKANTKFINKIIRLSGYAAAIDIKEVLAIHYIRLTDSSLNVMRSIQCMFDKKYADTLRGIQKGQQITVQGKYTGSLIAMRMSDCTIISP